MEEKKKKGERGWERNKERNCHGKQIWICHATAQHTHITEVTRCTLHSTHKSQAAQHINWHCDSVTHAASAQHTHTHTHTHAASAQQTNTLHSTIHSQRRKPNTHTRYLLATTSQITNTNTNNWTRQPQPATRKSATNHHKTQSVAANCWNHDLLLPTEVATSWCQVKPVQSWAVATDLLLEGRILSTRTRFWSFPVSTFHFQASSLQLFDLFPKCFLFRFMLYIHYIINRVWVKLQAVATVLNPTRT